MTLLNFPNYECENESDVEQKFIFPLLTHPSFLDLPQRSILTKKSLKSFSFVEKSTLPKNYIPDYLISFSGFPVCVVEAKGVDVPVAKAVEEARLYAQVLNSQFPHGTNPVLIAVGCNGREIAIGVWDSNQSKTFSVGDMIIGSDTLASIRNLVGVTPLLEHAAKLQRSLARSRYVIPARSLSSSVFVDRVDLRFSDKHEAAALFADYLVREKSRLDAQNPLFRERCREAERLVRTLTYWVNYFRPMAERMRQKVRPPATKPKQAGPRRRPERP